MNNKILVISGTNRDNSRSLQVARHYASILTELGIDNSVLSLSDLPADFLRPDMYSTPSTDVNKLVESKVAPASKYVFILPEYNGGYPGVVKLFIDGIPPATFYGKKAGLIGLSSGHLGNTRGLDAFGNVLNYLRVNVLYRKTKLSAVESLINESGEILDARALTQLKEHAEELVQF